MGRDGLKKGCSHSGVEHAGFVHNEKICVERMVSIDGKTSFGWIEFEESVNGLGKATSRFSQPLGGSAGRRSEVNPDFFNFENY